MLTSLAINRGGLGRFGNNCFTIAGVIGTAVKNNQPYAFLPWITKDNEIFGEKPDNINDYLQTPLPALASAAGFRDLGYFWGYLDLRLSSGNWNIDAHMQSEKFFHFCMPLIRETFRFKDEPEQNNWVAIHYRAGDYINDSNAYHPRCSKEYYEKAMALFPAGTVFNLFSDNPTEWYQMMGDKARLTFFSTDTHYLDDFKLMKRCKHFITANSSFSLFAAILGEHPEKKIVAPKRWFGSQANGMPTDDIYPEGAIII